LGFGLLGGATDLVDHELHTPLGGQGRQRQVRYIRIDTGTAADTTAARSRSSRAWST
jgi:hypothetical protein